jgi:hypothetical protein
VLDTYPPDASPLRLEHFFQTLYLRYEERFVFGAPDLKGTTQRLLWSSRSPALQPDQLASIYGSDIGFDVSLRPRMLGGSRPASLLLARPLWERDAPRAVAAST